MEAAALSGVECAIGHAEKLRRFRRRCVDEARRAQKPTAPRSPITEDPEEAARGADALYTDVWLSMGDDDSEKAERQRRSAPITVTRAGYGPRQAGRDLHALPPRAPRRGGDGRGRDGPQSVIFDQAENRLHTAVAVLYALIEGKLEGRASAG